MKNSRKTIQARGGYDHQLEKSRNHHLQARLGTAQGNRSSQEEKRPPKQEGKEQRGKCSGKPRKQKQNNTRQRAQRRNKRAKAGRKNHGPFPQKRKHRGTARRATTQGAGAGPPAAKAIRPSNWPTGSGKPPKSTRHRLTGQKSRAAGWQKVQNTEQEANRSITQDRESRAASTSL